MREREKIPGVLDRKSIETAQLQVWEWLARGEVRWGPTTRLGRAVSKDKTTAEPGVPSKDVGLRGLREGPTWQQCDQRLSEPRAPRNGTGLNHRVCSVHAKRAWAA